MDLNEDRSGVSRLAKAHRYVTWTRTLKLVLVEGASGGNSDNLDEDEKMNKEDNSSGYEQCIFINGKSLDIKQGELEA